MSTPTPSGTPGPKKRKIITAAPPLPKPKKQKLPRNLDNILARKQLPDAPAVQGVNKAGKPMVKGPYKKREKKDKDGKKITPGTPGGPGSVGSSASGAGAKKGKLGKATTSNSQSALASGESVASRGDTISGAVAGPSSTRDTNGDEEGPNTQEAGEGAGEVAGEAGEGKEDDDDEHEEEPEYTEYEWNQEANSRGRSKEELRALLDRFSEEQLQRYEVYRRSVLSKSTVKKLVGAILNQQVSPTMAFVVAGFCKVFVGEMVEKAREVMEEWGESGAIRPEHLREAQRRYKSEEHFRGKGVNTPHGYKKHMFCR